MLIKLYSQAMTTPKIRAAIQASDELAWVLAERHGTSIQTARKWRKRDTVEDCSHTPHRLQTTLTPAQEAVTLRKTLLVSLHNLLAVVREFLNPNMSRSGLDRCLRRHGVGNLRGLQAKAARPKHSGFKAYEPGYIHIDVKYLLQMADETLRRYLFVAIDRATRWVFIRIFKAKTAANARRFLRARGVPARSASARSLQTTEKRPPTGSLACRGVPPRASMSSTGPAPSATSSTASPRRNRPRQTARSSALTGGSRRSFKVITSDPVKGWRPRCTATSDIKPPAAARAAGRPCKR